MTGHSLVIPILVSLLLSLLLLVFLLLLLLPVLFLLLLDLPVLLLLLVALLLCGGQTEFLVAANFATLKHN